MPNFQPPTMTSFLLSHHRPELDSPGTCFGAETADRRSRPGLRVLRWVGVCCVFWQYLACGPAGAGENLLPDPSFEETKPRDRWGFVFSKWGGWIYEGECEFRVSDIARNGRHSLLMVGGTNPKIRASPAGLSLDPGRYRYRLVVDGRWQQDPYNETVETNEFGEYNSVVEVQ